MEVNYGLLCLIPPIVAIVLALITKQTLMSLFVAIWVGSTMINGYNPIIGFVKVFSDYIIPSIASEWNAGLLVLVALSGGLIAMLRATGSAQAFSQLVTKKIDSAKKGQIATALSAFVFSYTEPCLILGTIMRPVTDTVKVSRAKLAYILDSLGCNLASFSPISSYGPFITGLIAAELTAGGIQANEWGIWLNMLPLNMYGLFAMTTVFVVAIFELNIGPMHTEEIRARKEGKLLGDGVEPLVPETENTLPPGYNLKTSNFAIPMISLFTALFGVIFWSGNISSNGFAGCFQQANITLAITMGFVGGGIGAGVIGVKTKLFSPAKAFSHFIDGMVELINVPFILICAWSVGSITSQMQVGAYIGGIVQNHLTPGIVPFMVFIFGALISFATGSSWGVWSIMMPIAFPMAIKFNIPLPYVVAAVIGGGLFGDQCSPISDTTILSSTGASCNHIVHVQTQLPYGITVGSCAALGFLVGGLTKKYAFSVMLAAVILIAVLVILSKASNRNMKTKSV